MMGFISSFFWLILKRHLPISQIDLQISFTTKDTIKRNIRLLVFDKISTQGSRFQFADFHFRNKKVLECIIIIFFKFVITSNKIIWIWWKWSATYSDHSIFKHHSLFIRVFNGSMDAFWFLNNSLINLYINFWEKNSAYYCLLHFRN